MDTSATARTEAPRCPRCVLQLERQRREDGLPHGTRRLVPMQRHCTIPGCPNSTRTASAKWCHKHYSRWRRHRDPLVVLKPKPRPPADPLLRFVRFVMFTESCWLWTGSKAREGYGKFRTKENGGWHTYRAHRWLYEAIICRIPNQLPLDHSCRTPACVNPDHLEPVTHQINTLRGDTLPRRWLSRTHCNNGHEYTPENTQIRTGGSGRRCRECERVRTWRRRGQTWKLAAPRA